MLVFILSYSTGKGHAWFTAPFTTVLSEVATGKKPCSTPASIEAVGSWCDTHHNQANVLCPGHHPTQASAACPGWGKIAFNSIFHIYISLKNGFKYQLKSRSKNRLYSLSYSKQGTWDPPAQGKGQSLGIFSTWHKASSFQCWVLEVRVQCIPLPREWSRGLSTLGRGDPPKFCLSGEKPEWIFGSGQIIHCMQNWSKVKGLDLRKKGEAILRVNIHVATADCYLVCTNKKWFIFLTI